MSLSNPPTALPIPIYWRVWTAWINCPVGDRTVTSSSQKSKHVPSTNTIHPPRCWIPIATIPLRPTAFPLLPVARPAPLNDNLRQSPNLTPISLPPNLPSRLIYPPSEIRSSMSNSHPPPSALNPPSKLTSPFHQTPPTAYPPPPPIPRLFIASLHHTPSPGGDPPSSLPGPSHLPLPSFPFYLIPFGNDGEGEVPRGQRQRQRLRGRGRRPARPTPATKAKGSWYVLRSNGCGLAVLTQVSPFRLGAWSFNRWDGSSRIRRL